MGPFLDRVRSKPAQGQIKVEGKRCLDSSQVSNERSGIRVGVEGGGAIGGVQETSRRRAGGVEARLGRRLLSPRPANGDVTSVPRGMRWERCANAGISSEAS